MAKDLNGCSGKIGMKVFLSILLICCVLAFLYYANVNSSSNAKLTTECDKWDIGVTDVDFIERQTGDSPLFSIIWLHGLGADGYDFEPIISQLEVQKHPPIRFLFPHAPVRPISVNNCMEMRGWYDINKLPIDIKYLQEEDRKGIEQSAQIVEYLIEHENKRGIPTKNIFLAGFSQGGTIALFTGLRHQSKLAGIIALSTYLADAASTQLERSGENQTTSIFFGHGLDDPLITIEAAISGRDTLIGLGYDVEWHTYNMPHSVYPKEIQDIANFLKKRLIP
jgi:phospholipase/carboxylesterase